ncbi:MAG TPA: hypothetical protein VN809_02125 [Telmatospirillum sp.]|nr:hypothetical protein [Telmatospirillum sp.]
MTLIACKLLLAPLMIGTVTLAGRRFGVVVSGLLVGLPLTSGPISFLLAYEYGLEFGERAAVASLAGYISNCAFCLAYVWVSRRYGWRRSVAAAIGAFLISTAVLSGIPCRLWLAFLSLLSAIGLSAVLIPKERIVEAQPLPPAWDLPARIAAAVLLTLVLTELADILGPQLSGLITPFPAFVIILSVFTHSRQSAPAARTLLRGFVLGSPAFAVFYLLVGGTLADWGLLPTYLVASLLAVAVSGLVFAAGQTARVQ